MSTNGTCFNDLRAVLLAHDKRLLSILSGVQGLDLLESILPGDSNAIFRSTLTSAIAPTVLVSILMSSDPLKRSLAWSAVGGTNRFIYKPSLLGKGAGIVISPEIRSKSAMESFCNSLQHSVTSGDNALSSLEDQYISSGIVQPFYTCQKVDLPCSDGDRWQPSPLNLVGTLLCMDGLFYGPGFFRASSKNLVALSTGGYVFPAALHLPEVHPEARFVVPSVLFEENDTSNKTDLNQSKQDVILPLQLSMRKAFELHGAILTTSDGLSSELKSQDAFRYFIDRIFGGCCHANITNNSFKVTSNTISTDEIVWHIKQSDVKNENSLKLSSKAVARSHTDSKFNPHTDASWLTPPPIGIALSVVNVDRFGGGRSTFVLISDVMKSLPEQARIDLVRTNLNFTTPSEFCSDHNGTTKTLPLFIAENRIRYRRDIMALPATATANQNTSLRLLDNCIKDSMQCASKQRLLPEKAFILLDNQRFLHSRNAIHDPDRHLMRIRFSLPDNRLPRLDLVLAESYQRLSTSLAGPDATSECTSPLDLEARQFSNDAIDNPIAVEPGYWSCSGRSGTATTQQSSYLSSLMCTNSDDNDRQRAVFARAVSQTGILHKGIHCLNLYTLGHLYRSGEIIGELLRSCSATNIAVGKGASSSELSELLANKHLGINAIGCFSTELVSLARLAQQGAIDLSRVQLVIFAGEPLPPSQRSLLRSVCSPLGCQFLGLYGSAETSVFAYHVDDCRDSALNSNPINAVRSCPIDDRSFDSRLYKYPIDIAHIEILPLSPDISSYCNSAFDAPGVGQLVVTNLLRRPYYPRYNTLDLVSPATTKNDDVVDGAFLLHGRHPATRSLSLGRITLYFDLVTLNVLKPVDLHEHFAQIELSTQKNATIVTLCVHLPNELLSKWTDREMQNLSRSFKNYIENLTQCNEIQGVVRFVTSTQDFARSETSSKLIKFIDLRTS